ncbi:translocation/assembly module TamB domain-containing protein [Parvularcula dongshanensis]|uniref:Autotransporter translocation and assembly factor TamB n=1 Tax=Parvularcula dongshanensis TaxID=1173995 RepID=A0A840I0G4_9PROT|nr:translocation/assembly module TamB domain-containing protein [Parvularcula dongshanensis]MBB4657600.1 autotransporter translocation and assembly factor TamB [Parvularcula dongshanensis]
MLKEADAPAGQPPVRHHHWWARALRWLGVLLVVLIALLLLAVFVLPKTDLGRGFLDRTARPIVEEQVRAQLGSDIDFAPLQGALPGELILEDVVLSENGEPWFTADRIRLDWSPLALIRRDIVVNELAIRAAELHRPPPPRPEQPQKLQEESGPLDLPSITVKRFVIDPLTIDEPVAGDRYVIEALASLDAAGQDIAATIDLKTASGSDTIALDVDYDPETLAADVTVTSREDGLIATLSRAEGPVTIRFDGEGPLASWGGQLDADVGGYGSAEARLTGDLRSLAAAKFEGTVRPGPVLPPIVSQITGDALTLNLSTLKEGEALSLRIDDARGRFGRLAGDVQLSSPAAETVEADLSGRLSETLMAEFGAVDLAGPVSLEAQADQTETGWTFDGNLQAGRLSAQVQDGSTGTEAPFQGTVTLRAPTFALGNDRLDPILAGGLRVRAAIDYRADGSLAVADIDARAGAEATRIAVTGNANYDTNTQGFDAQVNANVAQDALGTLLGTGQYDGPLVADVAASGTPQDAQVRLNAQLPAGAIEGAAFGTGSLRADFAGLPSAPDGRLTLTSTDGAYSGDVRLRQEGQTFVVDTLAFEGGGLRLTGEGRGNPETRAVSARFNLDAGTSTTLLTGQTVGGTADATVEIAPEGGPVAIDVAARNLTFNDISVTSADIEANGPLNAVRYEVALDDASLPAVFLSFLQTAGTADVATPQRRVEIDRLRVGVNDDASENTVSLLAPTAVEFGEVIALDETRLDWLGDATLTAQARYAPDLWVAEVTGRGLSLPGLDAAADIDLAVDTREATPGRVQVTANATPEDADETYTLTLDGTWSGEQVSADAGLGRSGSQDIAQADIAFPVRLTREGGQLGIELPEEGLEGRVRYQDELAPLYAFVPVDTEYLTGRLDADVRLSGALTAPAADGTVRLTGGRFEEEQVGIVLQDITANADLAYSGDATAVTLTLNGADANGRADAVNVQGDVRMSADSSNVDVTVRLDEAQLADTPELEFRASSDIALQGPLDRLALAGTLNIEELDAQIPTIESNGAPTYVPVNVVRTDAPEEDRTGEIAAPPPPPFKIALDLRIRGNNAIFVRGRGLDSEWSTDLRITGTTLNPVIGGDIRILDGTFDFAGRTFDLTQGTVNFQRGETIDPRLNIQAEYDAGSGSNAVTAIVNVRGPASDPEITLSSNPPRPQEDVMALILFGKQPTELTALESLQIANAVAKLSGKSPLGGGGPGIGDKLRSSLGLDALSFGVDSETGQGTLGIGKYITDDVYVSARQSAGDTGSEITVTYEVTDNVTLESILEPNGTQGVSANYKKDY